MNKPQVSSQCGKITFNVVEKAFLCISQNRLYGLLALPQLDILWQAEFWVTCVHHLFVRW